MKTKKTLHLLVITMFIITNTKNVSGQNMAEHSDWNKDHLFPAAGKSTLLVSTGIPYIGSAEFAYGFTNRFSAGIFIGLPFSGATAYGMRLRKIIFSKNNNLRIYAELPIVFYPSTKEKEAWFLVYPNLMIEKHFNSGVRFSAGAGLPGASCLDALFGGHEKPHSESKEEKENVFTGDGGIMGGAWYTLNMGIAFPIAKRIMFQQRLDVVMQSIKTGGLHKKDWFYKPPIIVITGITYSL